MEPTVQQFKTGDRVRVTHIRPDAEQSGFRRYVGLTGEVVLTDGSRIGYRVRFPDDTARWFTAGELVPAEPTHPQTITLDGVTYTLTPAQEAPAGTGRRKPKKGEVWHDHEEGDYVLITGRHDEDGDPEVFSLADAGNCAYAIEDTLSFAYPTLRAAFEAGALS